MLLVYINNANPKKRSGPTVEVAPEMNTERLRLSSFDALRNVTAWTKTRNFLLQLLA